MIDVAWDIINNAIKTLLKYEVKTRPILDYYADHLVIHLQIVIYIENQSSLSHSCSLNSPHFH